jgi:hypothetical protein
VGLTAGIANLVLAACYLTIGTLVAVDLEKDMRRRGWSHFGVSWLTIMFTCGGHHLVHGVHLAGEGRPVDLMDVVAVGLGIPAGAIWSWLRIEAKRGGRGDRMIRGTPTWLPALATGYAVVTAAVAVAALLAVVRRGASADPRLLPNILLVGLYIGVGAVLWRGQHRNVSTFGGWSLSGLSLMMIFPTCALMHGVYVAYAATATFTPDFHGLWIDWLSVPAAAYFLWVVRGLERGTVRDWNERFEAIGDLAAAVVPPAAVPAPAAARRS